VATGPKAPDQISVPFPARVSTTLVARNHPAEADRDHWLGSVVVDNNPVAALWGRRQCPRQGRRPTADLEVQRLNSHILHSGVPRLDPLQSPHSNVMLIAHAPGDRRRYP